MIVGAHAIIYSRKPERDRAFLRDVLRLPSVDAGGGWLVFGLPPSEVAVHPSKRNDVHESYLLTDDAAAFAAAVGAVGVRCSPLQTQSWGVLTSVTLPGGGRIGVYEPRHARPKPVTRGVKPANTRKRALGKPARSR